jgi:hypothetical protein
MSETTISVQRGTWADLAPELAEMVAPPIVVSALPLDRPLGTWRKAQLARSRGNMPVTRHRRSGR